MHEKATSGNVLLQIVIFFICSLTFTNIFLPCVACILETFHYSWYLILLLQVYHDLYICQQFSMWILNDSFTHKRYYIHNILIACTNILLLILSRNAFPACLQLISGNEVCKILDNVLEGIIDRNVSIVFVLFFKLRILTEALELTCAILLFLFSVFFVACDLF